MNLPAVSEENAAVRDMLGAFAKNRSGQGGGIFSVCSAHHLVLEACMQQVLEAGTHLLIEATANQVNQFGGYTGMKPDDFPDFEDGAVS